MKTLKELMIDQLKELYNAEIQLKILIEKMAYQTSSENLRHSFEQLSKDTEAQHHKLDRVFALLGIDGKENVTLISSRELQESYNSLWKASPRRKSEM